MPTAFQQYWALGCTEGVQRKKQYQRRKTSKTSYNSPSSVIGLLFQFHGLILYNATKENLFTENQVWNRVLREVAEALDHIHGCCFIHNDLKSNNVVVEQRKGHPSLVIQLRIKSLFKRLNFKFNTTVENAVEKLSDFRPSLRELRDSLV